MKKTVSGLVDLETEGLGSGGFLPVEGPPDSGKGSLAATVLCLEIRDIGKTGDAVVL